jgi:disulfide bond formation protein DsbB
VTSVAVMILTLAAIVLAPSLAVPHQAYASSRLQHPSASSARALPADLNGDGFSDLAVGVPGESLGDASFAGAVNVLYGSATGLVSSGSQFWHQDSPGLEGDGAEAGDGFGGSLVAGDFNGDGFGDLAVGALNEGIGPNESAGAVNVLYGSGTGLTAAGSQFWHQDSPGVMGASEDQDFFGWSLAAADFNADGFVDLGVGVPGEDFGSGPDVGAVNVLYGSSAGLTATDDQVWQQDSPGIGGTAELNDRFGISLAAGDFNGNSFSDLAIGADLEDIGRIEDAGAVNVLHGSSAGLTATGNQVWHQNSPGVSGTAEGGDRFGASLAAADLGRSSHADLAVGVPAEDVGVISRAGAVNVLYGSTAGLTATGNQVWHQNSPGVNGTSEVGDSFGSSLAAANFGGSSHSDLAIGVPPESIGSITDAGVVNVLYGSTAGLTATGDQLWHQNSPDVEDVSEVGDRFGVSVAAADFGNSSQADLAVGVPFEGIGPVPDAGGVNALYGSSTGLTASGDQFWHQDSPGVEDVAEEFDDFGFSLAGGDFGSAPPGQMSRSRR